MLAPLATAHRARTQEHRWPQFAPSAHGDTQPTGWDHWALACLSLGLAVRLAGVWRPLLGDFATKNVIYAMIARNWALGRASVLEPTVDMLCGGERGWHLVELPVPAYLVGGLWRTFGGNLDVWGRGTTALASTAAGWLLYDLVRRRAGRSAARAALVVWLASPVSIIYGQSLMLESWLVLWVLFAFWAADPPGSANRAAFHWLSIGALALALLTKIYAVVWLPAWWWLLWQPATEDVATDPAAARRRAAWATLGALAALAPALAWCAAASDWADPQGPTAERVFYSLRASAEAHQSPAAYWFNPAFWAHCLLDLGTLGLTPVGLALALAGVVTAAANVHRRSAPWLLAALGSGLLIVLLPRKFAEMNYYLLLLVPVAAALAGLGWQRLSAAASHHHRLAAALALVGLAFSARYAVRPAFVTPAADASVVTAAQAAQKWIQPDEPVATSHGSAPDLLYYVDHPGWAISPSDPRLPQRLEAARLGGARYWVVAFDPIGPEPDAARAAMHEQPPVDSGPGYRVYRLASAGGR